MVSALVYSQCKLGADDCKSCETRNLNGEASDHDVSTEINLSQIQHLDCDITVCGKTNHGLVGQWENRCDDPPDGLDQQA